MHIHSSLLITTGLRIRQVRCLRVQLAKLSSVAVPQQKSETLEILGNQYKTDSWTNVHPKILSLLERNLHRLPYHPLCLLKEGIVNYFNTFHRKRTGNPLFTSLDKLPPVVSLWQNFDSVNVPLDHPSRKLNDSFYINSQFMLRAHTSAHQYELIQQGFDNFLVFGDVYRRDAIDRTHYPAFHQAEGVRLFSQFDLFPDDDKYQLFDQPNGKRTRDKQELLTVDASKMIEHSLKQTLEGLAAHLFGGDLQFRWVDVFFPFTHPSWELEIFWKDQWIEVLGCGIVEQNILQRSGAGQKVGWAFGLGLERLAMKLYDIPDIRLFWSQDERFLAQFKGKKFNDTVKFKPLSRFPPCINDISFWLPNATESGKSFSSNDFYDIVRSVSGDLAEQVDLVDSFVHPKTKRESHCYRVTYRHMEKTFTQEEVNQLHKLVELETQKSLGVEIR